MDYRVPTFDLAGQFREGQQRGQNRAALRDYFAPAAGGDQNALAKLMQVNPQAAQQAQGMATSQRKTTQERIGQLAGVYAQTGDPGVWREMRQSLADSGFPADMPWEIASDEDRAGSVKFATAIAQQYGGASAQSANTVQSRFVGEDGQVYALMRDGGVQPLGIKADPNMQIIEGAGGFYGVNRRNLEANPVQVGQPGMQPRQPPQIHYTTDDGQPIPAGEQDELRTALRLSAQGQEFNIPVRNGGDLSHIPPLSTFMGGGQLQPAAKTSGKEAARQMSPQEVASAGLPAGSVAYMGESGVPQVVHKPGAAAAGGGKPMPVGALKEVLAIEDAIGASKQVAETLNRHAQRMVSGELVIRPENAIGARIRTATGFANQNDVNLTEFKADVTRTVNEWLRLNKGVQTEGDAQREYKAIMDSNDPKTAARAVERLAKIIEGTVEIQRRKRDTINRNYGLAPQKSQPASGGAADPLGIL